MTREEHLMTIAMEECNETAHRISKALRFGLEEVQANEVTNPDALTNRERIRYEFSQLAASLEMIGVGAPLGKWMDEKRAKVERYLEYSKTQGTLQP